MSFHIYLQPHTLDGELRVGRNRRYVYTDLLHFRRCNMDECFRPYNNNRLFRRTSVNFNGSLHGDSATPHGKSCDKPRPS